MTAPARFNQNQSKSLQAVLFRLIGINTTPNGCLPSHTERRVLHVEVYEANYYAIPKLYAREYATLERPDYPFSDQRFGHWDDGHPTRVNQWLERIQAASVKESMRDNDSNSQRAGNTQTREHIQHSFHALY